MFGCSPYSNRRRSTSGGDAIMYRPHIKRLERRILGRKLHNGGTYSVAFNSAYWTFAVMSHVAPAMSCPAPDALLIAHLDAAERDQMLRDANINPRTGLATDYLNHFNEAIMLLEMIPDMPECADDFLEWRPLS